MQMGNKGNVVLYLDKDLVDKSKELGFNLSKTFENHLKQLILQRSNNQSTHKGVSTENKINWWADLMHRISKEKNSDKQAYCRAQYRDFDFPSRFHSYRSNRYIVIIIKTYRLKCLSI